MVSPSTIVNCFRKAGLSFITEEEEEQCEENEEDEEEDNFSETIRRGMDYILNVEKDIPCFGQMTDEDILNEAVDSHLSESDSDSDSDVEVSEVQKPTITEALKSLSVLKKFCDGDTELDSLDSRTLI